MTSSSLEKLAGRVRSAMQETSVLRTENSRLKAHLSQLAAERDALQKQTAHNGSSASSPQPDFDRQALCERLKSVLERLNRLEQQLGSKIERQ
jgi:FtsZ-binding cell division protein ZapB